jgi:methionyl-tRNA synthetase
VTQIDLIFLLFILFGNMDDHIYKLLDQIEQSKTQLSIEEKKVLITSALPYVNNIPHLGNLIGSVLSADVFARYMRLARPDSEVLFVSGTDEHGSVTELQAAKEGLTCMELCDKYHALQKQAFDWFECSYDTFGRTTNAQHVEITHSIFWSLYNAGFINGKTIEQLFCGSCNRFLADRYVEGICYHCGEAGARGDQCDICGKMVEATLLKDPKCKLCSSGPTIKQSKHLFLNLTSLQGRLEEWHNKSFVDGNTWTHEAITITKAWMKKGLEEKCITRDLSFGVPVPIDDRLKDYAGKVFYVWFDAPIGYISILAEHLNKPLGNRWYFNAPSKSYKDWWCTSTFKDNVELHQFMGKDNIPFHSIVFPSTLIGASANSPTRIEVTRHDNVSVSTEYIQSTQWLLPTAIHSTDYLLYEGGKFSKSLNRGVFCSDAMTSGIPAYAWRYYLLSIRPESGDSSFSWTDFRARINSELSSNLGNFIHRTLTLCHKLCGGIVPHVNREPNPFTDEVWRLEGVYKEQMNAGRLREGLRTVMDISSLGNAYLQKQAPWKKETAKDVADQAIAECCYLIERLAVYLDPFLPSISSQILKFLHLERTKSSLTKNLARNNWLLYKLAEDIYPLIQPIDREQIEHLQRKFGGTQ